MDRAAFGNPFAKAAIEMALYDVWGKAEGRPVFELLGGACRPLVLPIRFSLAAGTPEMTAALAAARVREGFRTIKGKVGGDPGRARDGPFEPAAGRAAHPARRPRRDGAGPPGDRGAGDGG